MKYSLALLLAVPLFAATPPTDMEKALAGLQSAKSAADAAAPLGYVLAHAQEAPSPHMFIASAAALQSNRLQDAGYLYYAAQLRARYDLARFPPVDKGPESPGAVLSALSHQIGGAVNPAVMREPKTFSDVIARVSKWTPVTAAGYNPTWKYTTTDAATAKKVFDGQHDSFIKQLGGLSTLLNDPQYYAAFKVMQDFNLATKQPDAAQVKARDAAAATMMSIEKKRDIEGLVYRRAKKP